MKALVVARLEQMDELMGDNHVEALDGVGSKFACDADGGGFGRALAPARLHTAHGDVGHGNAHGDLVCVHDAVECRGDFGRIELVDANLELFGR